MLRSLPSACFPATHPGCHLFGTHCLCSSPVTPLICPIREPDEEFGTFLPMGHGRAVCRVSGVLSTAARGTSNCRVRWMRQSMLPVTWHRRRLTGTAASAWPRAAVKESCLGADRNSQHHPQTHLVCICLWHLQLR